MSSCRVVLANRVAEPFIQQIAQDVSALPEAPLLVGFLANDDPASRTYAEFTGRTAEANGFRFELRECAKEALEDSVMEANADEHVDGIMVYFPVFGGGQDLYIQQVISREKDVEGLCHFWVQNMYHNIRYIDPPANRKKSILPCTPLAIVKILEYLQVYNPILDYGNRLYGKTIVVINRSEVVGRPLAALLANDGAKVYSVDITGVQLFTRGQGIRLKRHEVSDTDLKQDDVLPLADVVISGVPSASYKVPTELLRDGVCCINFSSEKNFDKDAVKEHAGIYVPSVGKVTIAMLLRNLLRLRGHRKLGQEQA